MSAGKNGKAKARRVADFLFAAALLAEAAALLCLDFGAGATAVAAKVSAVLDVLAAIGFAAKMRPSNFLVFKGFAFAGFFLYAHYSFGGATFTTAAAFSALLGLAAKIIL